MRNRLLSLTLALVGFSPLYAQTLNIAMTGDVMMGTTFPSIMLPANEGRDLFRDAKDVLVSADLTWATSKEPSATEAVAPRAQAPTHTPSAPPPAMVIY